MAKQMDTKVLQTKEKVTKKSHDLREIKRTITRVIKGRDWEAFGTM